MDHRKNPLNRRQAGFTLVELMLVIAVMSVLLGISGNFFSSGLQSQRLAATARLLSADLDHAVLLAQKENQPIEVRFYRFVDQNVPRDKDDPGAPQFRAYQFAILTGFDSSNQPVYRMLNEITRFPSGVMLMPSAEFNTVASLTARITGANDPQFGSEYTIASFQIRPDGSTSLPRSPRPVITLVDDQITGEDLPPNYRSITLDPDNGHTRVY